MNIFIARVDGDKAWMSSEESWHCCKVLRMKAGENIALIDGKGWYYDAVLEQVSEKNCQAKVIGQGRAQKKREYSLHLAIAPTKSIDRTEWLLEKLVEIGVDEISLIRCKNSERTSVNIERLRKIVESAVKQSLQARIPVLNDLRDIHSLWNLPKESQGFIAHCSNGMRMDIREIDFKRAHTLFLIGPEGDFSSNEIESAIKAGYMPVSLGENRLRTETAGLFVAQAALLLS